MPFRCHPGVVCHATRCGYRQDEARWHSQAASVGALLAGIEYLAPLHAMLLLILLARQVSRADEFARIDGLTVAALSYTFWFVVVPLRHLLG